MATSRKHALAVVGLIFSLLTFLVSYALNLVVSGWFGVLTIVTGLPIGWTLTQMHKLRVEMEREVGGG